MAVRAPVGSQRRSAETPLRARCLWLGGSAVFLDGEGGAVVAIGDQFDGVGSGVVGAVMLNGPALDAGLVIVVGDDDHDVLKGPGLRLRERRLIGETDAAHLGQQVAKQPVVGVGQLADFRGAGE